MTNPFTILRSGFDTLELSYGAALPDAFLDALEAAKQQAAKSRRAEPVRYRGVEFLVEASGAQGGYAYRVSTGIFGAIWTFRDKSSRDPWTTHVKLRAHGLATKGLLKAKADCDDFLNRIGSRYDANDARVSRADFAIDVYYPSFTIQTEAFVSHARTLHAEIIDRRGNSETCNYARFGKLPGKQLAVYQKAKKIIQEKDLIWIELLETKFRELVSPNEPLRDVWRFELRAGKTFITDRIGLRRWDKFVSSLQDVFLPIWNSISLRVPSRDTNRTRWHLSPIWVALAKIIREEITTDSPVIIPANVLARLREDHVNGLDAQQVGLIISRAALDEIDAAGLSRYIPRLMSRLAAALETRPHLDEELARRRERAEIAFGSG